MNISQLRELVRTQIHRVIESDGYPIQVGGGSETPSDTPNAGQNAISALPGVPFGGRIHAMQLSIMPNEAREALKNWAKVCRWASQKHGSPDAWPALVKQAAIELGKAVEAKAGQSVPGSDTSQNAGNLVF